MHSSGATSECFVKPSTEDIELAEDIQMAATAAVVAQAVGTAVSTLTSTAGSRGGSQLVKSIRAAQFVMLASRLCLVTESENSTTLQAIGDKVDGPSGLRGGSWTR